MRDFIKNLTGIEKVVIVAIVVVFISMMVVQNGRMQENQNLLNLCLQERPTAQYECRAEAEARKIQQDRNTAIILNGATR
jgi:uncharacterized membrane protein (DUF106 family)